jgi:glucose-6-phosphate 1-dehydrogenase
MAGVVLRCGGVLWRDRRSRAEEDLSGTHGKRGHLNAPSIGVAKAGWGLEQLRARAKESVEAQGGVDPVDFDELASLLRYVDGEYRDPGAFDLLRRTLASAERPLHYLAIHSSPFAPVAGQFDRSGCARGGRVVVEKPFGHDLASAPALNRSLLAVFPEGAVFRSDQLLGKAAP